MRSSNLSYYTFRYGLKIASICFLLAPLFGYLFPEHSKFNGKNGPPDVGFTVFFVLIALFLFLMGELISRKLVRIEVDNNFLKILQHDSIKEVRWDQVEKISRYYFVYPPLYQLKIKGSEEQYLFTTGNSYLQVAGFVRDLSAMGKFITRKKKDFGF